MITLDSFKQLWENEISSLKKTHNKEQRISLYQRCLAITSPVHTGLGMAWLYDRLIVEIATERAGA